jgi:hypothetical protein
MTDNRSSPDIERAAFIEAYRHLDLTESNDPWGRRIFEHSHVQAAWDGWLRRASLQPAIPTEKWNTSFEVDTPAPLSADAIEAIKIHYQMHPDAPDLIAVPAAVRSPVEAATPAHPADEMIGQIEERFPNWRSYRDLVDCIDVTLHRLRGGQ